MRVIRAIKRRTDWEVVFGMFLLAGVLVYSAFLVHVQHV